MRFLLFYAILILFSVESESLLFPYLLNIFISKCSCSEPSPFYHLFYIARRICLCHLSYKSISYSAFQKWDKDQQDAFLAYCTGQKGLHILHDPVFKEILNPELSPGRVEELLSLILGEHIKILHILPLESPRIGDEHSLIVMDLVVKLETGSIVNIEVQKLGYRFPGQHSACYSADLLLRQYKRMRNEKSKSFSYKDIKKVYTIVLYEKSTSEFHQFPENYIHRFSQQSDTGISIDLLQEYVFIPLDIFYRILHNKGIRNQLEAWLTFLSTDEPEMIEKLIRFQKNCRNWIRTQFNI